MLIFWIGVGLTLGHRLTTSEAISTGVVYGAGLGFSSMVYGYRGDLWIIDRMPEVLTGVAIGALCGAAVTSVGSAASEAVFGRAQQQDWEHPDAP
jgi:hypothetical protein